MGQVIGFVAPTVQGNVDALVVCARSDTNAGAGELGTNLIETTGGDAFLGAVDVVC